MQITSIQQAKKDEEKVNVFLDGEFWSSFTKDDLVRFGLHKGLELSLQEADDLKKRSRLSKLKLQALRKYSGVLKSEKDIRTYLYKKELEKDELESVIEYLYSHNVVDDVRFAQVFTESKLRAKKYSINKIKAELKKKGISDKILREIDLLNDSNEEVESIKKYIQKNSMLPKEKLIQRLLMRGFQYSNIKPNLPK